MLHRENNSNLRGDDITENPYFNIIDCDKRNIMFHPSTPIQVKKTRLLYKTTIRTEDRGL